MTRRTVAVLTYTRIAHDPRVSRHVDALSTEFDVVTIGVGSAPQGAVAHFRLPEPYTGGRVRGLTETVLRASRLTWAARKVAAMDSEARRLLSEIEFDLLLCNDAETIPVSFDGARGRPVVVDMHEYAPRHFENDRRWRVLERPMALSACRLLPGAAAVTTVSSGLAGEYLSQYGVRPTVVWNAAPFRRPVVRWTHYPIRLVHTGASNPHRSLELLIQAAAGLDSVTLDLYLKPGRLDFDYTEALWRMANQTTNVRVLDPVAMGAIPGLLLKYDVGFYVLPPVNFNCANALPNKFFDFVQAGLGVVVGPTPDMAELTAAHDFGVVAPDFSMEGARLALTALTPSLVDHFKRSACSAAEQLSGEHQAHILREVVRSALSNDRARGHE